MSDKIIMNYTPTFDKGYKPLALFLADFKNRVLSSQHKEFTIVVERNDGFNYIYKLPIFSAKSKINENFFIVERIVKTLLWLVGGYKIYLSGDKPLTDLLKDAYSPDGLRSFDYNFMANVYEKSFEVIYVENADDLPKFKDTSINIGGHLNGCRIGFDAGGSDRKVSAVIDGEVVYSEEVVWFPKINSDYNYHYEGIKDSFTRAASKMPRVDAIGVSSAGVYIANKIMVGSLFNKIPKKDFDAHVKTMYIDIAKEFNAPIEVANDGDVTALCGAMELKDNCVLGIAMGTSEAGGYIDKNGCIKGWLNELAFVPVDANKNAIIDEWSGDFGCGAGYFSQDAVIKLAQNAGIVFDKGLSPAEKLKVVQSLVENGDKNAMAIFEDIGIYLAYTLLYYCEFYDIKYVQLLGRVTSGKGGNIMLETAKRIIKNEFPQYSAIKLMMPDESNRRVGQSIAAASLTEI